MAQLTASGVMLSQTVVFQPGGVVSPVTRVTFMVGTHGPFHLDFMPGNDSPQAIKNGIDAKVLEVNAVASAYPAS